MKFLKKISLGLLALVLVFSLAGCSNFSKVKKSFEKNDWEYVDLNEDSKDSKMVNEVTAELEEGNITCRVHLFKKVGTVITDYAIVIEFESDADLDKALSEDGSATLKGLITDAQKSKWVNGTCILIPTLSNDAVDTFNSSK